MKNYLLSLYENSDIIDIPSKAGWFKSENSYHFITRSTGNKLYLNDCIQKFTVEIYADLEQENVIKAFVEEVGRVSLKCNVGILFLYRLAALLMRMILAPEECVRAEITLVGQSAVTIARTFLRTMQNDVDTVNIDSDRIGYIRDTLLLIQDTPVIFASSDPDNKSTQNRISQVKSWINTGLIESTKVVGLYVFCIQKFSKSYPLEETVVLDVDRFDILKHEDSFERMQSVIVEMIEFSGEHWINEFRKEYKYRCMLENESHRMLPLVLAISAVIKRMFHSPEFNRILDAGEDEIRRQLSTSRDIVGIFKDKVIHLIEKGAIIISNRNNAKQGDEYKMIFYDASFYYLTKKVFDEICILANIDLKSCLYVKQKLIEREMVKLYRYESGSNRDLEIDFQVKYSENQKKNLSGFAIKREFFDELGGIALYERR